MPHPSRLLAKGARAQPFPNRPQPLRTITPSKRTLIHGAKCGNGAKSAAKNQIPHPLPLKKHPPEGIRIGQASKNQCLTKITHDIIGENHPSKTPIYIKKQGVLVSFRTKSATNHGDYSPSGGTCSNNLFQVFWFFRNPFFISSRIRSKSAFVFKWFQAGFF